LDAETFGYDIAAGVTDADHEKDAYVDLRALTAFIRRNDPTEVIRRELLRNGPIVPGDVQASGSLIERMRNEVRQ
jgi:hypothetical protein